MTVEKGENVDCYFVFKCGSSALFRNDVGILLFYLRDVDKLFSTVSYKLCSLSYIILLMREKFCESH